MSFNLSRNTRVFITTDVNATTGAVNTGALTAANTFELQVLDGYSFAQNTQNEVITISEGGATPTRGQQSFNTALDPVDWSFSTYIRPRLSTTITAEEKMLWAALSGTVAPQAALLPVGAITGGTYVPATGVITFTGTAMTGTGVLAVGDIVTPVSFASVSGGAVSDFNTPIRITAASATSVTGVYLIAPTAGTPTFPATTNFTRSSWAETTGNALVHFGDSNKHQLMRFGVIFLVDGTAYVVDNAALDQASIDFGLDAIAMVAWTGKGTTLRQITGAVAGASSFTSGLTGTFTAKNTSAAFIANKLSTLQMRSNIGGVSGTTYSIAITGGNITIANNLTYLTPANLGVVNTPVTYFTGTRSISGSLTAYLRGISQGTSQLLTDMLAGAATDVAPSHFVQLELGGATSSTRVEFELNNAVLKIPTVNIEQVVSTQLEFTAQGHSAVLSASSTDDLAASNEMFVRYYGV